MKHILLATLTFLLLGWVGLSQMVVSAETGASPDGTPCDITVLTVVALNNAIDCFNNEVGGIHEIDFGGTITISGSGTTPISNNSGAQLTIDGNNFTLDGADAFRGLEVAGGNVTIYRLTIASASADDGAAIKNSGTLTVTSATLRENAASNDGGAIFQSGGHMYIRSSDFISNTAMSDGGAVFIRRGTLTSFSTEYVGNSAENNGGAFHIGFGGNSPTVDLNGCCIDRNRATNGGGIYIQGGNVTLGGIRLRENVATEKGGGVRISVSTTLGNQATTLSGGFIQDNVAGTDGAGIYVSSGTHTIGGTIIERNVADADGGGVFVGRGNVTLNNTYIFSNTAKVDGGGLYVDWPEAIANVIEPNQFEDNVARHDGGGLYVNEGFASVQTGQLIENKADLRGGAVYVNKGEVTVISSTLMRNRAGLGGGLFDMGGTATISNSTFSSNASDDNGGGIYINLSTAVGTLSHSTIAANSAVYEGGGIFVGPGTLNVHSSIVADNSGSKDCGMGSTGTLTVTASLIESSVFNCGVTTDGGNIVGTDPSMDSLGHNGGPTLTHELNGDSMAINQGDNRTCPILDQRGYSRPDGFCDMGAFEFMGVPTAVTLRPNLTINRFDPIALVAAVLFLSMLSISTIWRQPTYKNIRNSTT